MPGCLESQEAQSRAEVMWAPDLVWMPFPLCQAPATPYLTPHPAQCGRQTRSPGEITCYGAQASLGMGFQRKELKKCKYKSRLGPLEGSEMYASLASRSLLWLPSPLASASPVSTAPCGAVSIV